LEATLHGRITELENKQEEQNKVEATIRGQRKWKRTQALKPPSIADVKNSISCRETIFETERATRELRNLKKNGSKRRQKNGRTVAANYCVLIQNLYGTHQTIREKEAMNGSCPP